MNSNLTGDARSRSSSIFSLPSHVLGRLYLFAGVLILESAAATLTLHTQQVPNLPLIICITAFAVFLALGHSKLKGQFLSFPVNAGLLGANLFSFAALVYLRSSASSISHSAWFATRNGEISDSVTQLLVITLLALACLPFRIWISAIRDTSPSWLFALSAGIATIFLRRPLWFLWIGSNGSPGHALTRATFNCVRSVLSLLLPNLVEDAPSWTIGTQRFAVTVLPACSGIEGLGLVLVFTVVWLWFFRKECRFPQALLLVPCALCAVWMLNIARIATLVLIGNAGAPEVAMIGFHSVAGLVAFTIVALSFSIAMQRLSWVRRETCAPIEFVMGAAPSGLGRADGLDRGANESAATDAYLVPFLAILGASFISKAASGYFEWLYPLRFAAAAVAFWIFRAEYRKLNWRFNLVAPAVGAAIFLVWVVPGWWSHGLTASPLGTALASLSPAARITWIVIRLAAAVVTVPVAEELAFRGYLARRLVKRDFDDLPFTRITLLSMVLSSAAFGLMHGQHWIAGMLAGLAFAALSKWRGRIGDAVVAHATSNLLLGAWVLLRGDWAQW